VPDSPAGVVNGHFTLSPLEIGRGAGDRSPHTARARVWESPAGV